MRRYWISIENFQNDHIEFSDEIFHHIFSVCRQEIGSKFEVLVGDSKAYLVEVVEIGRKKARARVLESRVLPILQKPHLVLALSLCRYQILDAIVEKAVEMGVSRIQLFYSEYSFIRKKESLPKGKIERWNKIVKSATQQCGRGDLMPIASPIDFSEIPQNFNPEKGQMGLFAYEGSCVMGIKEYLKDPARNQKKYEEIWTFIGGEGGFSQTEVQYFKKWGLDSVSLGEQVLRVETACIALVAILKYEYNLMRSGGF